MLQQKIPKDYVIATGEQHSVRDFLTWSWAALNVEVEFKGSGVDEIVMIKSFDPSITPHLSNGQIVVRIDPRYYRPAEVETLLGDPTMAATELGWKPKIYAREMCREMVWEDMKYFQN